MPRLIHGATLTLDDIRAMRHELAARLAAIRGGYLTPRPIETSPYGFLLPELQADADNLLPTSSATVAALTELGQSMSESTSVPNLDSDIPSAYTYFGQFVDHDITFEAGSAELLNLTNPNLVPLSLAEIAAQVRNGRTASLDLDSVYGIGAAADGDRMLLGEVSPRGKEGAKFQRPLGKDSFNDLPRLGRDTSTPELDRAACIGDGRNDENLIVSQLHVAFLRAHNALVDLGASYDEALVLMRQHYQEIVLHDFLPKVADPDIVADTIASGGRIFNALETPYFMPLEFSAAAYRFGHSMVRDQYEYNLNFKEEPSKQPAALEDLFTFTAMSGQLGTGSSAPPGGYETLPEQWIIEWERFVDVGQPFNRARKIDVRLAFGLFHLRDVEGVQFADDGITPGSALRARLGIRNLLRGYRLRLPTGQAVVRALNARLPASRAIPVLSEADILAVAIGKVQVDALNAGGFTTRTPLWFYILAEASRLADGQRLGPVGSTIVAEVLVGLAKRSASSMLRARNWRPTLRAAEPDTFTLPDLLRLAKVLRSGDDDPTGHPRGDPGRDRGARPDRGDLAP